MNATEPAPDADRLRQLELMHAIDRAVLGLRDPMEVAELAARPLAELARADRLSIAEHDHHRRGGRVLAITRRDDSAHVEIADVPYEQVVPNDLRDLRETLLVPDLADADPRIPWAGHVAAQGLRHAAVFPLVAGDELVGVVQLVGRDAEMLNPERVAMAREIVTQLAVSIVHARAAEELAASRDRLALLHAMDGWIIGRRPVAEIAQAALAALRPRLGVGRSSIIELLPDGRSATVLAVDEDEVIPGARAGRVVPREELIPAAIADEPTPHIFSDISTGEADTPAARVMVAHGYRSACWLPMVVDGIILGAMVHTAVDPTPFSPEAVGMAAEVATQLAIAIRSERERLAREASTMRMEVLHAIDRAGLIAESPAALADEVLPRIRRLVGAERAVVLRVDAKRSLVDWLATDEADDLPPGTPMPARLPLSALVTPEMVAAPDLVAVPDLEERTDNGQAGASLLARGLRSSAYMPFVAEGRLVGALNVSWRSTHGCDEAVELALRQVGDRFATALARFEARAALEQSRTRLELLHEIDRGILAATTGSEIARRVAEPLRAIIGARLLGVAEAGLDPTAGGSIVAWAGEGADRVFAEVAKLPATRVLPPALRSQREIITVPDIRQAPGMAGAQATIELGCVVGAVVPLVAEDQLVGVISLASDDPGMLDADRLAIAREVGDQLAVAIRHANARAALERAVARQALVHEIDRAILDATSLEDLAAAVSAPLLRVLRAQRLDISVYDLAHDEGRLIGFAGDDAGASPVGRTFPLRAMVPMADLDNPEIVIREDIAAELDRIPLVAGAVAAGLRAGAWVPLIAAGELVGAIGFAGSDALTTTAETIATAREVGDQLAVAIVAARDREAVADREERLRAILEASPNGILTLDLTGAIQYANPAAHRLFAYEPGMLVGGPVSALISESSTSLSGERLDAWFSSHDGPEALRAIPTHPLDVDARRRDGSTLPVHVLLAPVSTGEGPLIIATVVDLSERASYEARLRQAERLEVLGQFAGILAHDVRNYLTAVTMAADFIAGDMDPDDEHREDIETIKRAAQDAVDMTRSVLEFSRPASSTRGVTNVTAHLGGARTMLGRILGGRIRLELDLPDDLPSAGIDSTGLTQVVGNLATNAVDAMPAGGVFSIRGAIHETAAGDATGTDALPPGRYVRLVISDTGTGMDEETRSKAFDAFFTTKRPGEGRGGTGLGLASVFLIVNRCGGAIHLASTPGVGTTFTVDLPVA